jgi:adenine-specific DNA methylase
MSSDTRLIEQWLPIAALGMESLRERTPMTPFPAPNRLHVWWARRPLIASRAAILASLLHSDVDRDRFLHVLGIHGDPVNARMLMARAVRGGTRVKDPYGYPRAFAYAPDDDDRAWLHDNLVSEVSNVLDPTAGGGSIPFESARLGMPTLANDLNPVASTILAATVQWPTQYGRELLAEFESLSERFRADLNSRLHDLFPQVDAPMQIDTTYLVARTITCPYCEGLVPLSPNWKLCSDGTGVKIHPQTKGRRICGFEIVTKATQHSVGTVADGDARCSYADCERVIDGDEIKRQAQAGEMGEQLYAVVYKRKVITGFTKAGKEKVKWERGFRSPRLEDDNFEQIRLRLADKLPEWEALDLVPTEALPEQTNYDRGHKMYGVYKWSDMFSPRQLLCHGTSVEVFREMLEVDRAEGVLTDLRKAAHIYLALAIDTMLNYATRSCRWDVVTERVRSIFDKHNFAFCWSYSEMAPLVEGLGYDWALDKTGKCLEELCDLVRPEERIGKNPPTLPGLKPKSSYEPPATIVTCKSADALDHIEDESVDVVVMDPPYYDNVMYAELSDFFYVWLKRTAGYVMPELFRQALTDKEHEAVANLAKFKGQKNPKVLAGRDYQQRMAGIFAECRRVLKPSGIMTLMFTHKATGAWDALTKGLMDARFSITASWPINTEAEGSMHIKDKAAANSTIFLVCRPRAEQSADVPASYWEEVEPLVAEAVRLRIKDFQDASISGVDLYLACFGPALQKFSEHWPLRRGTPRPQPEVRKRRKQAEMFEEEWDPYEVTPEDALDAARREVKRWRLQQLTHMKARTDLDPLTSFYVLAWDAFKAPRFDYDEALRLARAVGVDMEKDIIGHLAEKKASEIILWDSAKRAAKGALGPIDGSRSWLDTIHHAAYAARSRNLQHARELLSKAQVDAESGFFAALEAVLEVLPVSKAFSGIDLEGEVAEFGNDFEALENLRKLAFASDVDEPEQMKQYTLAFEEVEAAKP